MPDTKPVSPRRDRDDLVVAAGDRFPAPRGSRQIQKEISMDLVKQFASYLLARLGESSTWATVLAYIAAQTGLHLNPDLNGPITQIALGIVALVGVLIKEGWQAAASAKKETKPNA
jgi:hypothetical protein